MPRPVEILSLASDQQVPAALKAVLMALPGQDHRLLEAADGENAINLLTQHKPQVLVLALDKEGYSGNTEINTDFIARAHRASENTALLVLTADISPVTLEWLCCLPVHACLQAPCKLRKLQAALESLLQKRQEVIEKSRPSHAVPARLYKMMVESSPDMIFIVDEQACFTYVNERVTALLGYQQDELTGRHYSEIVSADDIDRAGICFHERRSGTRSVRAEAIWLLCRSGHVPGKSRSKLAVELSSAAMYEDLPQADEHKPLHREYLGTCVVARDITERLDYERIIQYQAYHDQLTGLPNRTLFADRLQNAISNAARDNVQLGIMFLDLDRFKLVNDSLGHALGDLLLQEAGSRLKSVLREGDTIARFGGDEFMVLLPRLVSEKQAEVVGHKIIETIRQPFHINGHEIFITVSIGLAMYPRDGTDAETLVRNSDIAMYHSKEQGRNSVYFFEADMSVRNERLLNIENEIRKGIHKHQFELYYQPQIDVLSGRVSGVEALLRWNHPEKGLLLPSAFLAAAEESGLMVELGEWVLETAIQEMQAWRQAGLEAGCLAVNFSAAEIEQADFVDKVLQALKRHAFPAQQLEVEVTENAIMNDIDKVVAKLQQLHRAGIHVAIDDFGTGYSSLSRLQQLPINRLKIDQSFVHQLGQEAGRSMLEGIAHMARGLKLEMVAEGVEQDYQLSYLQKLKCTTAQGFIFSEGIPVAEMWKFLQKAGPSVPFQKPPGKKAS